MTSLKHIKFLRNYAVVNKFLLPKGFENKSPQWLRKQYNGIGAEWMPKSVRKLTTKAWRHMEAIALPHDIEFLSKNKSFWNFTKANLRLLYNSFLVKYFFSGLILFFCCQLFGWSAWKEGKETMAYYYYFKENEKK
jgi:hypothetical protein